MPLCYSNNGDFYDIGANDNTAYFQPLSGLENELDFDFAASWIEELCRLNGLNEKFNDNHRKAIRHALILMKNETSIDRRTISYFRHLVQDYDREVADILDGFSSEKRTLEKEYTTGFINKIFDANNDLLQINNSRFSVFEMSKLMELGDRIVIPALRYLIHVVSKQFDSGEPTLIVFDESFLFFKHPLFRERIIEWIKTVRKFNVAVVFATTEIADLFKYDDLRSTLKTNCATKIFLPNRKALNEDIFTEYQAMGLNDKQIELVAQGVRGEYFYMSDLGTRKFTLDLYKEQATFAYVAKTSGDDIKRAIKLRKEISAEEFGYYWLKECNVSETKQNLWQKYYQEMKTEKY